MGFFYWGEENNPANKGQQNKPQGKPQLSRHEQAHKRAGRGERMPSPNEWTDSQGNRRISHGVPWGKDSARRTAVVIAAGYLSSRDGNFEDNARDRREAADYAKEAGVPIADIEAEARRKGYVL